jgi:drug/metabolite transporter (DMT)-like permease
MHDKLFLFASNLKSFKILKYNFPYLFYLYLPKIFSIIFVFITKSKIKSESNIVERNTTTKNYHIMKINEYEKRMFFILFIVSTLEVLYDNIDSLSYFYQMKGVVRWLIEKKTGYILFVPIFSYFLLGKDLYKHHILALLVGLVGAIIVNACRFFLNFSRMQDYPMHLLNVYLSSLYSLSLVLLKYIMTKFIVLSPYYILFYDGIFCIIISAIITCLEYFIVPKLPTVPEEEDGKGFFYNNFVEIITIFKGKDIRFYIVFFISMIFSFCYYASNIFIIYNYSPFVNIIVELVSPIDSDILDCYVFDTQSDHPQNEILKRFLYQIFGYIILLIAALILNEIIVFNFWGLNTNTYLKIMQRSKNDSIALLNVNNENDDESEGHLSHCSEE